jgi:tetratricopeptide (TPR) repeat protein
LQAYSEAIALQQQLVEEAPFVTDHRRDLVVSFNNRGLAQSRLGKLEEASGSFHEALRIQQALVRDQASELSFLSRLGGIYNNLAMVLQSQQKRQQAAEAYENAIRYQKKAFDAAPQVEQFREHLSKHYFNYGQLLRQLARPLEAAEIALKRKTLWPSHPERLYSVAQELAAACDQMARQPDRPALEGESGWHRYADEAVAIVRQVLEAGWHPVTRPQDDIALRILQTRPGFSATFETAQK